MIFTRKNNEVSQITAWRNKCLFTILYGTGLVLVIYPILYFNGIGVEDRLAHALDIIARGLLAQDLSTVRIGVDGKLPSRLYTRQITICLLGDLFMLTYIIISILITKVPLTTGYEGNEIRMMRKHNWSRLKTILVMRLLLILFMTPMTLMFGWLSMNAKYGWCIFQVNDTISLITFSISFLILPGYCAAILFIVIIEYLVRDLINLTKLALKSL